MPISQTDFDDACDDLLLAGETPTIERMRAAIGGGSPGTVGPMLKAWKARRAEEDALRDIPVPASLSDDAALTLARLWKRAMAEATAGHDAMRRDLVAARAEIAELHEDYLGQLCRMEADLDRAQTDRDGHRTRLDIYEAERSALSDRTARAEADAASATARMEAAVADARHARSESAAAEGRTDRMRDERDAARREGVDLVRAFGRATAAPREVVRAEREGMRVPNEDPGAADEPSSRTLDLRLDEDRLECALSPEASPAGHGSLNARMNAVSERLTGVDDLVAIEASG